MPLIATLRGRKALRQNAKRYGSQAEAAAKAFQQNATELAYLRDKIVRQVIGPEALRDREAAAGRAARPAAQRAVPSDAGVRAGGPAVPGGAAGAVLRRRAVRRGRACAGPAGRTGPGGPSGQGGAPGGPNGRPQDQPGPYGQPGQPGTASLVSPGSLLVSLRSSLCSTAGRSTGRRGDGWVPAWPGWLSTGSAGVSLRATRLPSGPARLPTGTPWTARNAGRIRSLSTVAVTATRPRRQTGMTMTLLLRCPTGHSVLVDGTPWLTSGQQLRVRSVRESRRFRPRISLSPGAGPTDRPVRPVPKAKASGAAADASNRYHDRRSRRAAGGGARRCRAVTAEPAAGCGGDEGRRVARATVADARGQSRLATRRPVRLSPPMGTDRTRLASRRRLRAP